jgi:hypothetical protein
MVLRPCRAIHAHGEREPVVDELLSVSWTVFAFEISSADPRTVR